MKKLEKVFDVMGEIIAVIMVAVYILALGKRTVAVYHQCDAA